MPEDDDDSTLVQCPACGGDARRECSVCLGAGCVEAAKAAAWRFERARRIASGTHRIDVPPKKPDPVD